VWQKLSAPLVCKIAKCIISIWANEKLINKSIEICNSLSIVAQACCISMKSKFLQNFFVSNLPIFVISQSVSLWQSFLAQKLFAGEARAYTNEAK
jgi:hypothetical protein